MADSAATPNDNAQEQKPQRSGKRKLFLLLLLLVVILAGVGVYCYHLFYGLPPHARGI